MDGKRLRKSISISLVAPPAIVPLLGMSTGLSEIGYLILIFSISLLVIYLTGLLVKFKFNKNEIILVQAITLTAVSVCFSIMAKSIKTDIYNLVLIMSLIRYFYIFSQRYSEKINIVECFGITAGFIVISVILTALRLLLTDSPGYGIVFMGLLVAFFRLTVNNDKYISGYHNGLFF